jgi:hypothetical protein
VDFDALVEILRGLEGKFVEVDVAVPALDQEPFDMASFSGRIDRVVEGGGSRDNRVWRIWLREDGSRSGLDVASFKRSLFLDADYVADWRSSGSCSPSLWSASSLTGSPGRSLFGRPVLEPH